MILTILCHYSVTECACDMVISQNWVWAKDQQQLKQAYITYYYNSLEQSQKFQKLIIINNGSATCVW